MITPTIGRIVWFHPGSWDTSNVTRFDPSQPLAAIVTYVWSDRRVNLAVFDQDGVSHSRTSVPLVQDGDAHLREFYCEWMPFQKIEEAQEALHSRTRARMARGVEGTHKL